MPHINVYDDWLDETVEIETSPNKPICDYRLWKARGSSLAKINHFENNCTSSHNPCTATRKRGFKHVIKNPWTKAWSKNFSNNSLGTEFDTKSFANNLQMWTRLEPADKTDRKFIEFFRDTLFV